MKTFSTLFLGILISSTNFHFLLAQNSNIGARNPKMLTEGKEVEDWMRVRTCKEKRTSFALQCAPKYKKILDFGLFFS